MLRMVPEKTTASWRLRQKVSHGWEQLVCPLNLVIVAVVSCSKFGAQGAIVVLKVETVVALMIICLGN